MSDRIQLLPEYVANQIAAGEVVQRPASIVKELLENALDAESKRIELIIRDAGKNLIQVVDNGVGMSPTDARMCFERHATSKIRSTEDIFAIMTKGFRGEALASIAAVAQVELLSRVVEDQVATQVLIEGGDFLSQKPAPGAQGTSISVKNLFYNVPARRKFLKSNAVELRHILDEFHRVALPHEGVEFLLHHNDEIMYHLRRGSRLQRICDLFGKRLQNLLVGIQEDTEVAKISGFVARPEGAKKNRGEQFFFVNGRFFRSPYFHRAIQDAFEGLIPSGYSPSYFIFIETDPQRIDVNIHPQKTEIKFEDESIIYALLRSHIKKSLGIYNIAPSLDFERDQNRDPFNQISSSVPSGLLPSSLSGGQLQPRVDRDFNPFKNFDNSSSPAHHRASLEMMDFSHLQDTSKDFAASRMNLFGEQATEDNLTQLPAGYWLLLRQGQAYILNPGRMHRVVVTGNQDIDLENPKSIPLMFSLEYLLNESEKLTYLQRAEDFAKAGFELELGRDLLLRIHAIPEGFNESTVIEFLSLILSDMPEEENETKSFAEIFKSRWLRSQSKSRYDFQLKAEMQALLHQFTELGFPTYTPQGKPCYVPIDLEFYFQKF